MDTTILASAKSVGATVVHASSDCVSCVDVCVSVCVTVGRACGYVCVFCIYVSSSGQCVREGD